MSDRPAGRDVAGTIRDARHAADEGTAMPELVGGVILAILALGAAVDELTGVMRDVRAELEMMTRRVDELGAAVYAGRPR